MFRARFEPKIQAQYTVESSDGRLFSPSHGIKVDSQENQIFANAQPVVRSPRPLLPPGTRFVDWISSHTRSPECIRLALH